MEPTCQVQRIWASIENGEMLDAGRFLINKNTLGHLPTPTYFTVQHNEEKVTVEMRLSK